MGSGIYCFGASSNCSKDPREDSSSQYSRGRAAWHIDVLLGSDRRAASVSFSNFATDLQAAPVTPHSPSCMILHVMMHLPKFLVTGLLPVSLKGYAYTEVEVDISKWLS